MSFLPVSGIEISAKNSLLGALAPGQTFTGEWENVTRYQEMTITIGGCPKDVTGILRYEFSPDNGVHVVLSQNIGVVGPSAPQPQPIRIVLPFVRVVFICGASSIPDFVLTTIFHLFSSSLTPGVIGTISVLNETTALLGANDTFTGSWESTLNATTIIINSLADADSAVDGWQVQWSHDGIGVVAVEALSPLANTPLAVTVTVRATFFRFVYINGATPQSSFFASCILQSSGTGLMTESVEAPLDGLTVSPVMRTFLAVKDVTAPAPPAPVFKNLTGVIMPGSVFAQHVSVPQLPVALSSGGNLKVEIAEVVPIDIGKVDQGTPGLSPWPVDVSDRVARLVGHVTVDASALPAGAATATGVAAVLARQADGSQKTQVTNFPAVQQVSSAPSSTYRHITTMMTTTCKSSAGILRRITINTPGTKSAATVNIDGNAFAIIATAFGPATIECEVSFTASLVVVTSATGAGSSPADITVVFD